MKNRVNKNVYGIDPYGPVNPNDIIKAYKGIPKVQNDIADIMMGMLSPMLSRDRQTPNWRMVMEISARCITRIAALYNTLFDPKNRFEGFVQLEENEIISFSPNLIKAAAVCPFATRDGWESTFDVDRLLALACHYRGDKSPAVEEQEAE